jgi:hypothetical protein
VNTAIKWILGTVVAGATAGALLVPKGDDDRWSPFGRDARGDSLYQAADLERVRYGVVRRVVERGEARETARAVAPARNDAPLIRIDPKLGSSVRTTVQQRVADELRGAGAESPRYPIAIMAQLDTSLLGGIYTQATVLPERAGDPCTVVLNIPVSQRNKFQPAATHRLLSTCAFYAAYGAPGTGTANWLVETRGAAARFIKMPSAFAADTTLIRLGVSYFGWDPLSESLLRCRMGITEGCDRFVGPETYGSGAFFEITAADTVDRSALRTQFPGVEVLYSTRWMPDAPRLRAGVLAELAAEIGSERFGALWRDERGLIEAYATSAGRPFSSWVANYLEARTGPYVAGPGIPSLQVALAVVIALGALGLAVRVSARQMS